MVLASLIPIRFPRIFYSHNCLYFFVFIACISILKILTNFFQLFIFSWHSLRYLSVSYIFSIFSLISLRDTFHFIFKNFYHLHSKVVFLCFICLSLFRYCCHRIVGPSWCHMAPSVVDGVLTQAFRHLAFGWLYALIYIPKFVFIWWVLCSSLSVSSLVSWYKWLVFLIIYKCLGQEWYLQWGFAAWKASEVLDTNVASSVLRVCLVSGVQCNYLASSIPSKWYRSVQQKFSTKFVDWGMEVMEVDGGVDCCIIFSEC